MGMSKGVALLNKYLTGGKLTRGEAILAKCADCTNRYADGRIDCKIEECPLYPWMYYSEQNTKNRRDKKINKSRHT